MLFAERPAVIDRRLDVLRTGTVAGLFVIQVLLFLVGLPLGADQFAGNYVSSDSGTTGTPVADVVFGTSDVNYTSQEGYYKLQNGATTKYVKATEATSLTGTYVKENGKFVLTSAYTDMPAKDLVVEDGYEKLTLTATLTGLNNTTAEWTGVEKDGSDTYAKIGTNVVCTVTTTAPGFIGNTSYAKLTGIGTTTITAAVPTAYVTNGAAASPSGAAVTFTDSVNYTSGVSTFTFTVAASDTAYTVATGA